jgi:hypothetical protein
MNAAIDFSLMQDNGGCDLVFHAGADSMDTDVFRCPVY